MCYTGYVNVAEQRKRKAVYMRQYRQAQLATPGGREENRRRAREYYWAHCEERKALARKHGKVQRRQNRLAAIAAYGGKCACCQEATVQFLSIDHVNGGGSAHRKQIANNTYLWLRQRHYPEGFQVLCHNCNMANGLYGSCPHSSCNKQPI
jgi:hypothetical protein